MNCFDISFSNPAANLAFDEALLSHCEESGSDEILRFWEPSEPFVVVGYANAVQSEVNTEACHATGVPVLRRCSGGGTILQVPGCLNYALILRIREGTPLATISGTNRFVMERNRSAIQSLVGSKVEVKGHTDLTVGGLKFSGNSQRRRSRCLLFHGTLLLNCELDLIERCLAMPSRQPDYRANRSHRDFLTCLNLSPTAVKAALRLVWEAAPAAPELLPDRMPPLVERYASDEWNFRF